ncbi:hypothetical protein SARC_06461 [Sphaeroforma arctica JP610]|uniref:Uncharacterized protein n=1 Tax=Sphaeroforma arctica JP610 TaxID=667725 RepID=A0A0L0FWJ0_9EUKA|nr:hypothetical protein SARC_06461 [Sphaeroforma arctica JP610]KNC81200.1 hypothetical protein SARC_06461 [Sphaeroforma arctica JP610]|eukprot:XP_014155102.1 hypothetical protein SARC_06461 [Sphaeroforma arctica JP610]
MHAFNPVEGVCAHGYRCGAGCSTCDTLAISVPSLQMKTKFKSSSGSYKRLSLVLALIFGGTMWWQIASACRESSEFGRYTEWIVRQSPHRKIETWHTMWTARQAVPITYKNPQSNEFKECPWVGQASLPFSNEDDAALATSFLKVLTETGLVFFTKAGSSLGIRRHGGFLPGDSDVDIGIPVWRNVHNLIGTEYEKYLCDDITSSAEVTLPGHERGK